MWYQIDKVMVKNCRRYLPLLTGAGMQETHVPEVYAMNPIFHLPFSRQSSNPEVLFFKVTNH